MDPLIDEINKQIRLLEEKRADRERELARPERQEIRAEYEKIASAIIRLEELGENLADSEDRALYVVGATFQVNYDGVIRES